MRGEGYHGHHGHHRGYQAGGRAHRQVLDVLVLVVDNVGQVLAVDVLLEDPHGDLVLELVAIQHVAADNLGDRRAPVSRANDANLLLLPWLGQELTHKLRVPWCKATTVYGACLLAATQAQALKTSSRRRSQHGREERDAQHNSRACERDECTG